MIVHSTQSFNFELKKYNQKCSGANCIVTIEAKASKEFCNVTGGVTETVEVKISMGLSEEARVKYYVACACACSGVVEINSPACNRNGNLSCGACTCNPGWYVPRIRMLLL